MVIRQEVNSCRAGIVYLLNRKRHGCVWWLNIWLKSPSSFRIHYDLSEQATISNFPAIYCLFWWLPLPHCCHCTTETDREEKSLLLKSLLKEKHVCANGQWVNCGYCRSNLPFWTFKKCIWWKKANWCHCEKGLLYVNMLLFLLFVATACPRLSSSPQGNLLADLQRTSLPLIWANLKPDSILKTQGKQKEKNMWLETTGLDSCLNFIFNLFKQQAKFQNLFQNACCT